MIHLSALHCVAQTKGQMMSKKTGGPAFPEPVSRDVNGEIYAVSEGMSLRDYFAGKAIQGLAANPGGPWQANPTNGWALTNCKLDEVTEVAYQIADSMLNERAKGE